MALSGNGVVKSSWSSYYGLRFYWSANQNIAGNYSDITVDVYAYFEYYALIDVGARTDSSIYVAGTGYTKTFPAISKLSNGVTERYLGSQTHRVYHASDGALSNVVLRSIWTIKATINGVYQASIDCSFNTGAINTIPRQANVTGANNFNDEANPYMTFNNAGGFVLNAYLEAGGGSVVGRLGIPNTGNYTFVLTEAERNVLRNMTSTNSLTVRYVIVTVVGGVNTWWSWVDRTMTIVNGNPVFTDYTYRDNNSTTVGVTGNNQVIVQGKSSLLVAISNAQKMVAQKGATAKNYTAEIDGKTVTFDYVNGATEKVIGTIDNPNNKTLTVRATDSRNNSTARAKTITTVPYVKPVVNSTVERLNGYENQTTLKVSGSISLLTVSGSNKNSISSLQYRRREAGGTWGSWTNLAYTTSGANFTATNVILSLDNTKGFEFEIRCIDKLDNTVISRSVGIGVPTFFVDVLKNSIAVGKFPEYNNSIEAVGQIYQNEGKKVLDLDLAYPIGSIYMSIKSDNPASIIGGTWVSWGAGRVPVGVDPIQTEFNTAQKTGGEKTHKLTVEEMPSHGHSMALATTDAGSANYARMAYQGESLRGETGKVGGNQAHNNLQPYITCYMWVRTA